VKEVLERLGWLGIVLLWYWPITLGIVAGGYLIWLAWRMWQVCGYCGMG
jgi:hypothetical protein